MGCRCGRTRVRRIDYGRRGFCASNTSVILLRSGPCKQVWIHVPLGAFIPSFLNLGKAQFLFSRALPKKEKIGLGSFLGAPPFRVSPPLLSLYFARIFRLGYMPHYYILLLLLLFINNNNNNICYMQGKT